MANHQNSSIRVYATLVSALKAPPHGSPGQRPGFRIRSVRPARAQESSALAGRNRYLGHVPGALPRAGMLRAVGASTWRSSQSEKTATDRFMRQALVKRALSTQIPKSVAHVIGLISWFLDHSPACAGLG